VPAVTGLAQRLKGGRMATLRELARRDFFPVFSAKVRGAVYNPFGVLVLAALSSLACGFFLHPQGFALAAGIGAVIAAGALWPLVSLAFLRVSIGFDKGAATEGDTCGARLLVCNRAPWSAWGLSLRGAFYGDTGIVEVAVARIPGRREVECRWNLKADTRGVYPLDSARLGSGFPFGVWRRSRTLLSNGRLVVWPRVFPVGPVPSVVSERVVEGQVSRGKVGSHGDVMGVRPYRRGDSPRRIHWGQSAKHDRLIVCELQTNARPLVQVVLDAHPANHAGDGADSSFEWAIRVAASLACGWLDEGAEVGFACAGVELPAAAGSLHKKRILDALAMAVKVPRELNDILACPLCRGFRDGLQVVVTTSKGYQAAHCAPCERANRRWALLSLEGFGGSTRSGFTKPGDAWLWFCGPNHVPGLLLDGWSEARHGS
jgi:uncharacterized protein (DUF58 family)